MISSDDHSPPDPQNSNYFKIHSDEKAHASVSEYDLNLFKSLIADLNNTDNPLPSFSIRDYVSNSRSKDIACNWPFSDKSLQICLQHGVKNLLPPFQSPESLRNISSAENPREEITISSHGKSVLDDDFVLVTSYDPKSNPELKFESTNTNSSRSKGEKESLTRLQEDLGYTKSKKTSLESSRKTEETTNTFIVSETMASKICPVCKTFSSSSNTTLNAHIDQCLSGESSMKWTANPKVIIKHRIKPRKTRFMVDIYETAPHCTVEELDARNGTSWANNSSFPAQELEFQAEEEKEEHRATTVSADVVNHEGAVYIDTNGTKVRILSVPKVGTSDDLGAHKFQKRGKLSKVFMEKKKTKYHQQNHEQKHLKLTPNSKKFCPPEVSSGRKEDAGKEPKNPVVRKKMDDLPIVRPPWACSKRTGLVKKVHGDSQIENNATKNLSIASEKSLSNWVKRSPPMLSTKVGTSSQNSRKTGTLLPYKEQPNRTKELSPLGQYAKSSPLLTKPSFKDSSDARSKGSKFMSFGKKISPVKRELAPKFSLKRKFSAIKRSCVHPSSKQKVAVNGSFQGPLKQKSREEEDTSRRMFPDRMNTSLLEVKNKEKTKFRRLENHIASRSSNGDTSAWLKANTTNPSCDVETVRKESQAQKELSKPIQVSQVIDAAGTSMALSNFLNPEDFNEKAAQIDPIQLPEPPGAFLPSPGRETDSEAFRRNSSFADTGIIQSKEDNHHQDTMGQDFMSESPISTISDPSLARSESDKLSMRSNSFKDDRTGIPSAIMDAINGKHAHATSMNASDWRSGFKNNQPCCCSRKEGASRQTVASSYHQSSLLRKQTAESFNFQPQMFSMSNSPPVVSPTIKLPVYSECDSVGSPTKPVLRLMGKNLTVADDVSSPHHFKPPPTVQNEYKVSSFGYHSQHPIIFSHNPNEFKSQHPNNLWPGHQLDKMFQSTSYMDRYSHGSPMDNQDRHRFDTQMVSERNMAKAPLNPNRVKEVMLIDDSRGDDGNGDMGTRRNRVSFSSIPTQSHGFWLPVADSLPFNNGSFKHGRLQQVLSDPHPT